MFNARLLPLLLSLVGLVQAIDWFEVENLSASFLLFKLSLSFLLTLSDMLTGSSISASLQLGGE